MARKDDAAPEDFREVTKRVKRAQAKAKMFDDWPDFKDLCLSADGYTPSGAIACLAVYAARLSTSGAEAGRLIDIAVKERSFWEASIKAVDAGAAGADGPPVIEIHVAPDACPLNYHRQWEAYHIRAGWTPPLEYQEQEDTDGSPLD